VNDYEKKYKKLVNKFVTSLTAISKKKISKQQKLKQKDIVTKKISPENAELTILTYQISAGIYTAMNLLIDFLETIENDLHR